MNKTKITKQHFTGERACFNVNNVHFDGCLFDNGESPIKESANIEVTNCEFGWKYPLWYGNNITVNNSVWQTTARAGVWYTNNIVINNTPILAPKNFRRCNNITLQNLEIPNAQETLWKCDNVKLQNIKVVGNYFAMNCNNVEVDNLELDGDYGFDNARNLVIRNSTLKTKDAFWNCENVTVENCFIEGEYFGWNSKNVTLINCEISSLQGFCYIDGLKLINCKLLDTTLSFEYCNDIDAQIVGKVQSVKNPISGKIVADGFEEIIMESDKVDISKTQIITRGKNEI